MGADLDYLAAVRDLFPEGELKGSEFWAKCPFHADSEPSFSIDVRRGQYFCFGCGEGGGFKKLIERLGLDWQEIRKRYGNGGPSQPRKAKNERKRKKTPDWERIWLRSNPNGSLALWYLRNRGLPVERLPEFFREYWTADGKTFLLVKLVSEKGEICGFQRIFLTPDGKKAPEGKKAWPGSKLKGSFALIGAEPKELGRVEILGVAEGPETALAVHLATGWPVLVAISAGNLSAISYPKKPKVIIFADKDKSGTGEREAWKAVQKLRARGQRAAVILPIGQISKDQKSLDFLDVYISEGPEAIKELAKKALKELEASAVEQEQFSPDRRYCIRKNGIWRCKDGEPERRLANFLVRIMEDFLLDFGNGETQRFYQIEAKINGRTENFWIRAFRLISSAWIDEFLGSEARLAPESTTASHLADAIKAFSSPQKRAEPARAGWVKDGNGWRFTLPGPLAREVLGLANHPYELLEAPDFARAREAIRLLVEAAPAETVVGVLEAAIYAPLSFFLRQAGLNQGLAFYLHGKTGHGKTTLARLILALYGPRWITEGDLPSIFNSTINYLQSLGFYWAYLPLAIDDLHPPRNAEERRHLTEVFSKILRTAANLAHRGRLQDAASLQAGRPFEGVPIFTGEISLSLLPSEATRLIQIPLERPLSWDVVSRLQETPEALASLGSLWVRWIEKKSSSLVSQLRETITRHRRELSDLPPRIRDNFAALKATFELFCEFLEDLGLETADFWEFFQAGISRLMGEAEEAVRRSDPVELFRSVFEELRSSGTLKIPAPSEIPDYQEIHGFSLEDGKIFVFPRKILAAINDFLSRSGLPLLPLERDLWRMLEEAGISSKPRTFHIPGVGKVWGRTLFESSLHLGKKKTPRQKRGPEGG